MAETETPRPLTLTDLARIERELDDLIMPDFEIVRRLIHALRRAHDHANRLGEENAHQGAALLQISSIAARAVNRVA